MIEDAPIPYSEVTSADLNLLARQHCSAAYDSEQPDMVTISGCPSCFHPSMAQTSTAVVRGFDLSALRTHQSRKAPVVLTGSRVVVIRCNCDVPHPEANGKRGCGRFWKVNVEAKPR